MNQERDAPDSSTSVESSQDVEKDKRVSLPKLIHDPIHGTMPVPPLAMKIINTPQFERLQHIRQLSAIHYVYPSGAYSRFEHSIGVCYLAGKLVNMFKEQQSELGISEKDVLCVQLAGLTRDLGHGPFSQLFEENVVPELKNGWEEWELLQRSVDMLDYIYHHQGLKKGFEECGLNEKDFNFIKSLIKKPEEPLDTGRGEEKSFLYKIVENGRNGIDVDKWDYLTRDSYHLGIKCGFDYTRLLYHMRVIMVKKKEKVQQICVRDKEEEVPQICVRDKEADTIYSMFHTRFELYKKAYQHRVVLAAELMIAEALIKAKEKLELAGKKMVECAKDIEAYTRLNDGVFFKILDSNDPDLQESREILERLQTRRLWKYLGQATLDKTQSEDGRNKEVQEISQQLANYGIKLHICTRSFGQGDDNPLDSLMFYSKRTPQLAEELKTEEKRTAVLPTTFHQMWLQAYYTGMDREIPEVKRAVKEAFERHYGNKYEEY